MSTRQGGADPPLSSRRWTCADVELWLLAAFRAMPTTAIYAPRGNTLMAIGPDVPSATFDIVSFSGTVLGDRSNERRAVLIWARCKATKGLVGGSIAQFCIETGWRRSTFEDRRRRACQRIADAKNSADAAISARDSDLTPVKSASDAMQTV